LAALEERKLGHIKLSVVLVWFVSSKKIVMTVHQKRWNSFYQQCLLSSFCKKMKWVIFMELRHSKHQNYRCVVLAFKITAIIFQ